MNKKTALLIGILVVIAAGLFLGIRAQARRSLGSALENAYVVRGASDLLTGIYDRAFRHGGDQGVASIPASLPGMLLSNSINDAAAPGSGPLRGATSAYAGLVTRPHAPWAAYQKEVGEARTKLDGEIAAAEQQLGYVARMKEDGAGRLRALEADVKDLIRRVEEEWAQKEGIDPAVAANTSREGDRRAAEEARAAEVRKAWQAEQDRRTQEAWARSREAPTTPAPSLGGGSFKK